MFSKKLLKKVNELPHSPGSYQFIDAGGTVIYVGKAKDLQKRVKSYFQSGLPYGPKTQQLVQNIKDVRHIEVMSEFEALILEAALIRRHDPKYNIVLKDDKSLLYVLFEKEAVLVNGGLVSLTKIVVVRRRDLRKGSMYFGPFPDAKTTKYVLQTIRKAFQFRDCSAIKYTRYQKLNSPCLYGHIGLCQAPCTGAVSSKGYAKDVQKISKILSGETSVFISTTERLMKKAAEKEDFEKAGSYRDLLGKLDFIRNTYKEADEYINNPNLIDDMYARSIAELLSQLPILKQNPVRIECYDISNLSGKDAAGAMTVAINGKLVNRYYRHFKVRIEGKADDYEMLREVFRRRVKRFTEVNWEAPELVVVDGGRGQVSAAVSIFGEIPVIGLAKRNEDILYKVGEKFFKLNLDRNNEGLKLLQRLRDEAHRFSRRYHHRIRLKKMTN